MCNSVKNGKGERAGDDLVGSYFIENLALLFFWNKKKEKQEKKTKHELLCYFGCYY